MKNLLIIYQIRYVLQNMKSKVKFVIILYIQKYFLMCNLEILMHY